MRYITAAIILMLSSTVFAGQFSNQYSSPTVKVLIHANTAIGTAIVNEINLSTVGLTGTATLTTGKFNNGISNTRTGLNYYSISKSSDAQINKATDDWLFMCWFYVPSFSGSAQQDFCMALMRQGGGIFTWGIGDGGGTATNDNIQYYQDTDMTLSGSGNDLQVGAINITAATWHHLAWYVNRSTGKMRAFIDGVADYAEYTLISGVDTRAPNDVRIGAYINNLSFTGTTDDVVILKRTSNPWTANECIWFFKQGRGERSIR
jgi:hypothetical protein